MEFMERATRIVTNNQDDMNKDTVEKIYLSRQDLSDYVFHFTRGANSRETLIQILSDGAIKDINHNGYLCFTEAPVLMLPEMFELFSSYKEPMFAPYGIGIHRDSLYKLGGRPVIYGTEEDKALISKELWWRFLMLKPGEYDFSWLREWRLPKEEYIITDDDLVIVNTVEEEETILLDFEDMEVEAEPADGGFEFFYTGKFKRLHKGLSMERIKSMVLKTKEKFRKDIAEQAAVEMIYLGSEWK